MTQSDPKPTRMDAAWLDAHWMPFTGNRQFKAHPRMIVAAEGAYYIDADGKKIFDGLSGPVVLRARPRPPRDRRGGRRRQVATLDYAPAFQFGHPQSFELANKIKELTPAGLDYVFFTGSGSEAADTSLKMARAYWRAKGQGTKTRLIGREKGYHGVNFGGISVGGIVGNRKTFGQARRGRSPAAHAARALRPGEGVHARHAADGRRARRRAAAADRAARRVEHRRRDRRAVRGLGRRGHPARRATCSGCARSAPRTTSC